MMDRRPFLTISAGLLATGLPMPAWSQNRKPRIAFLGTVVHQHSHAQHFLDRLTLGQTWGGRWVKPRVEVASIYLDQSIASWRIRRQNRPARHCWKWGFRILNSYS